MESEVRLNSMQETMNGWRVEKEQIVGSRVEGACGGRLMKEEVMMMEEQRGGWERHGCVERYSKQNLGIPAK